MLRGILIVSLLASAPAYACHYQRQCDEGGCYNILVGCNDELQRRNRDRLDDQSQYNRQRGYPEWDSRGTLRERQRRMQEDMRRGDGPGDGPDY